MLDIKGAFNGQEVDYLPTIPWKSGRSEKTPAPILVVDAIGALEQFIKSDEAKPYRKQVKEQILEPLYRLEKLFVNKG